MHSSFLKQLHAKTSLSTNKWQHICVTCEPRTAFIADAPAFSHEDSGRTSNTNETDANDTASNCAVHATCETEASPSLGSSPPSYPSSNRGFSLFGGNLRKSGINALKKFSTSFRGGGKHDRSSSGSFAEKGRQVCCFEVLVYVNGKVVSPRGNTLEHSRYV